jgi:hypothetical protein
MIARGQNFKQVPINIVGSSTFGRYPKISVEKTYNMFMSDNFMVPYSGYKLGLLSSQFANETEGRAIFSSTTFDRLVLVLGKDVYLVNLTFSQLNLNIETYQIEKIGELQTSTGVVYISENNKPQLLFSDGVTLYVYDPTGPTQLPPQPIFKTLTIDFTPGYITFHDTYFISAVPSTNTWRLSGQNDGYTWANDAASVGLLQTKPDFVQAVVRFPSRGNLVFVLGNTVSEPWFDTGAQLFPYQRTNQFNIDYGCLNPATVAYMDEIVVWLAANEKSGPIIVYSNGGDIKKITTDGIDYLFSNLSAPEDSQGFLYRQDGHLIYHINFYTDNLSLFYDFNTDKFYHASDQNLNFFIGSQVAFFNNQYYMISKTSGNLYIFDTIFTTYQDVDHAGNKVTYEIPRIRTTSNIRMPSQEYFIANDVGFTIESGETPYQEQQVITNQTIDIISETGNQLITEEEHPNVFFDIIAENSNNNIITLYTTPVVDMSVSYDGGASFSNDFRYELPGLGYRKNRLMWWQLGLVNDLVFQFKFWGIGRFVVTDGVVNIRQ